MLNTEDLKQIKDKGISTDSINKQLESFNTGFPYAQLEKAALINDGILSIDKETIGVYTKLYDSKLDEGLEVAKFVPASGAATRMFKALFEYIQSTPDKQKQLAKEEPYHTFSQRIKQFAFIDDLAALLKHKPDLNALESEDINLLIRTLLLAEGLDYGSLPKGLLKFHKNKGVSTTPVEEHLKETALYATNNKNIGTVHFTVSPEHHPLFKALLELTSKEIEKKYQITFDISFSYQKASTDTIAVKPDNTPFRTKDNALLFRPAGHGALIENLNELNKDLVFIKNIDNVVPEHLQADTVLYKKLLAGLCLEKKETIFSILNKLDTPKTFDEGLSEGLDFMINDLQISAASLELLNTHEQAALIKEKLNRPIRVCGMVKNEGEPGGGPFWVKQNDGSMSLQIVEGAQIDPNNAEQQAILKNSSHFNPVDLVCYLKDYKDQKIDLLKYTDPETGFISEKTQNGSALKALELPGLWNGAMANWLTFFVEVPISTFNPVKTVMDLLRPQHQPI